MLKKLISTYPRYFPWIIVWTLMHWLIFFPSRILSASSFLGLGSDFSILSPKDTNFLFLLFDHFRQHGESFPGLVLSLFMAFSIGLMIDVGLLPALSRSIRYTAYHHTANVRISLIFKGLLDHFIPALWRFTAWLIITMLLITASGFTLKSFNAGALTFIAVLSIEWLIMLSWFTHSMIALGSNQRRALFSGLQHLHRSPKGLGLGIIGWLVFASIATGIQALTLKLMINDTGSQFLAQLLFIASLLMIHFGKFSWIGAHALSQPIRSSSMKTPPIRRFDI